MPVREALTSGFHAQVASYLVESFHPNKSGQMAYALAFNAFISSVTAGG